MNFVGEEASAKYQGAVWLAGSASAEFCADIVLCPLKMTKVKIQTCRCFRRDEQVQDGDSLSLRLLISLLSCRIPYAMAKFFFEYIVGLFCKHVFAVTKETYVWQDDAARRHLRVRLSRCRRLAPGTRTCR
ncbi:hypothetical protein L226DRAFT_537152 [Lentinus tigrinus ALCF2SS1-7]|uniref:uncharacterized protein n=1 Tax=Lentinus tigrinus ALCF2SS1-7 TaxID=1328758 RepID=UPI001165F58F|nr:hypothetical protein L226DRAFT_537152 [Lentinus tigrinus ALCF2SS1-7]